MITRDNWWPRNVAHYLLWKLELALHIIKDVEVTLNTVAYVPGQGLDFVCLHAVWKRQAVVIDPVGTHVTQSAST